jgi:hypothetical protein
VTAEAEVNKMNEPDNKKADKQNKLSLEVRLIARTIEAFKENAIVQREQIAAQKEHTKHEQEVQTLERKLNRRANIFIALITLIGVAVTVFIGLYVSAKENEVQRRFQVEQEMQVQAREQGQELEATIRDKISARDRLNSAIVDIRNIREVYHLYCKNGSLTKESVNYEKQYFRAGYQFVNARFSIFEIFNEKIQNEAQYLLELVNNNKNICDVNAIEVDKQIQLSQRRLNTLMNNEIAIDKEKRKFLFTRESKAVPKLHN